MPIAIDKAILQLQVLLDSRVLEGAIPIQDAINLGIEALKAWKALREGRQGIFNPLLPGETEGVSDEHS